MSSLYLQLLVFGLLFIALASVAAVAFFWGVQRGMVLMYAQCRAWLPMCWDNEADDIYAELLEGK